MTDEHILTLIRAAQQAPTVEDKDHILQVILDTWLEEVPAEPGGVAFPLPIYLNSKLLGRKVEGLLFEDRSVEVDGRHWPTPSSNGLCEIILGYHTTMWPIWKYITPDGKAHSINLLKKPGGPFEPAAKTAR